MEQWVRHATRAALSGCAGFGGTFGGPRRSRGLTWNWGLASCCGSAGHLGRPLAALRQGFEVGDRLRADLRAGVVQPGRLSWR